MASVHEAGILSELLTLPFKRQHRRQVSVSYILFEAPFVELVLELFLPIDEPLEDESSMCSERYITWQGSCPLVPLSLVLPDEIGYHPDITSRALDAEHPIPSR